MTLTPKQRALLRSEAQKLKPIHHVGREGITESVLEALLLGAVQGLTEFLPISSSGHLILVPWLQDYTYLQDHESFNKTFEVALHAGTLVAVIGYFWKDLTGMVAGVIRSLRRRAIEIDEHESAADIDGDFGQAALILRDIEALEVRRGA